MVFVIGTPQFFRWVIFRCTIPTWHLSHW